MISGAIHINFLSQAPPGVCLYIPEGSHLNYKTIKELQVRKKTGVTIIAVRRGKEIHSNPEPDFKFKQDDFILFTGDREHMNTALNYFQGET